MRSLLKSIRQELIPSFNCCFKDDYEEERFTNLQAAKAALSCYNGKAVVCSIFNAFDS